jgi:hypothetical protein
MTVASLAERMGPDPFSYESHLPVLETCQETGGEVRRVHAHGTASKTPGTGAHPQPQRQPRILHPSTHGLPAFGFGYYYVHSRVLPESVEAVSGSSSSSPSAAQVGQPATPSAPSATVKPTARGLPLAYFAEARERQQANAQVGRHRPYHHPPTPIQQEAFELHGLHFECPGFQGLAATLTTTSCISSTTTITAASSSAAATASKPHATWILRNRARGTVILRTPGSVDLELMRDDILPLATGVGYVFCVHLLPNPSQWRVEDERVEMEVHLYLH